MKKLFLISLLIFLPQFAFAGSQTFTSSGTFTVPAYGTLTVEVWGGGGGGGGVGYTSDYGIVVGGTGGSSSFMSMTAHGGGGGYDSCYSSGDPYCPAVGGTATGGDVNTDGGVNDTYVGGTSPNGGSGGPSVQYGNLICGSAANGFVPGGGGAGCYAGGGGGGGGYAQKTYSSEQLTVGSGIAVVVGGGGAEGGGVTGLHGGSGAPGQVTITWTDPVNEAPTTPTISGPTTGLTKTSYTYTFTSTDPDSDTIRYGVDWDGNGSIDEYAPALGYVSSGTASSVTHSWNSANTQTFKVLAEDSKGATSGWASYTVNMSPNAPTVLLTATPSSVGSGQSSTLQWSSSNANSCTGTNFSTGGATSGTATVSPTQNTTYTVTCTGQGNQQASDSAAVTYTCTATNICSGLNVVNSCTGAIVQSCSYQCGAGACISPPPPAFNPDAEADLSGHLQLRPSLLPTGGRTRVFWDVSNVQSCTVVGDNVPPPADSWTVPGTAQNNWTSTSGATGLLSAPIVQRTTYTLSCTPLEGQTFTPETETVEVLPLFLEL